MRGIEREAIAAYLNSQAPGEPSRRTLVIESTTAITADAFISSGPDRKELASSLPEATSAVIDDFIRVLSETSALQIPGHLLRRDIRWQMIGESDIDRIFSAKKLGVAWENFHKAYPGGGLLVRFSRVGIDERAAQALFFASVTSGGLGGSGFFVLLHRRFGIWRLLATEQAWIS